MIRDDLIHRLAELKPWLLSQGVMDIALFGSHAHDAARQDSDIDLVVDFAPGATPDLFTFSGLRLALEERLGARVDLFTRNSLHPGLKTKIEASLVNA